MISLKRRSGKDLRVVDIREMELDEENLSLATKSKSKKHGSYGKDLSKVRCFFYNQYGHLAS
jgi:hypothetical protein